MIDSETRLAQNSLWMILSRFGAQGLGVVFTVLLARRLGSAGFGEYAFLAAVLFVANALTTFGTDMLLIREIAAQGNLSRLPYALIVQLVLSGLLIGFVWMFGPRIPNQSLQTISALKIYSLALIPLAFFTVFTTALRGMQRMDLYSFLNVSVPASQVVIVLLPNLSIMRLSILLVAVQSLAAILGGLVCSYTLRDFGRSWRFRSLELLAFLREAAPLAFLTLITMLYQRLSVGMLSVLMGPAATGLFSAAFRVVEASKTAHVAIFAALYPAMAQTMSLRGLAPEAPRRSDLLTNEQTLAPGARPLAPYTTMVPGAKRSGRTGVPRAWSTTMPGSAGIASSGFDAQRLNQRSLATTYLKYLLAGATVIALLLFLLAKPLVNLLYGKEFIAASAVLQILAWMLIPFTINIYLTLLFLASNRERLVGRALTVSLLGLSVLNLWWIPAWGLEGCAWAVLAAECIQSVVLLAGMGSRVILQGEVHEFSESS